MFVLTIQVRSVALLTACQVPLALLPTTSKVFVPWGSSDKVMGVATGVSTLSSPPFKLNWYETTSVPPTINVALRKGVGERGVPATVAVGTVVFGSTGICDKT